MNLVVLYWHMAVTICLQLILYTPHYMPQTPLHPPNSIPVEQTRANDGAGTNKLLCWVTQIQLSQRKPSAVIWLYWY